jgi:hypothetical protein
MKKAPSIARGLLLFLEAIVETPRIPDSTGVNNPVNNSLNLRTSSESWRQLAPGDPPS